MAGLYTIFIITGITLVVMLIMLASSFVHNRDLKIELKKIHKLVNSSHNVALDRIELLETQVENLGGPEAPPKRVQNDP